jgi:hypothetical protein
MEKRLRIRQTRPDGRPVKWDFLTEWEMEELADTPFLNSEREPGSCSCCGTPLPTEADFAKHFVLNDLRFLNLGECPRD